MRYRWGGVLYAIKSIGLPTIQKAHLYDIKSDSIIKEIVQNIAFWLLPKTFMAYATHQKWAKPIKKSGKITTFSSQSIYNIVYWYTSEYRRIQSVKHHFFLILGRWYWSQWPHILEWASASTLEWRLDRIWWENLSSYDHYVWYQLVSVWTARTLINEIRGQVSFTTHPYVSCFELYYHVWFLNIIFSLEFSASNCNLIVVLFWQGMIPEK